MAKNPDTDMSQYSYTQSRELSWLRFNRRVLEESGDNTVPLLERLKFISIFTSNLDEFFMVRVGSLVDQMTLSRDLRDSKTHLTAEEQIRAVLDRVRTLDARKTAVYDALLAQLEAQGLRLVDFRKIGEEEGRALEAYFDTEIAALLSPIMVGKRQPFPFLRSGMIYAVVELTGKNGKEKLGIIPCGAGVFPRLIAVPGRPGESMLSEELILHFIYKVFKGYRVKSKSLIRITRNADIDADALYDEDLDYREFMVELIKRRRRLAPVRLELSRQLDEGIVTALCRYADVPEAYVLRSGTPLDLSFLGQMADTLRQSPELFYERFIPQRSPDFHSGRPILEQIREKDKLLSYPIPVHAALPGPAAGGRQRRPGDLHQDDPLPGGPAEQGGGGPHRGGGERQGGLRPGGAEGPLRRGEQHRVVPPSGGRRLPGGLRPGRLQGSLQAVPDHP